MLYSEDPDVEKQIGQLSRRHGLPSCINEQRRFIDSPLTARPGKHVIDNCVLVVAASP